MPEIDNAATLLLLLAGVALMAFCLFLMLRISWRLTKIEDLITEIKDGQAGPPMEALPAPGIREPDRHGGFERFLAEDEARRRLTKAEQFTAYRRWRQEKGMNWTNS